MKIREVVFASFRAFGAILKVQLSSLEWSLRHALRQGDTDVFPTPFEYTAIKHDWVRLGSYLESRELGSWNVRPHRRLLSPKAKYGFRVVTQLDPLDFLLFTSLVYEAGEAIESERVSPHDERVFSFRFAPSQDGRMFDADIGYASFQKSSHEHLEACPEISHVVVTDISDFYARIYSHRIENALLGAGVGEPATRAILRFLRGWNEKESHGIPVGGAATRLLAELAISDIDRALLAAGVDFKRYNDDYRLFSKSYGEAYRHLAYLADHLLRMHGLTLQPQKTRIYDRDEFQQYVLDSYEGRALNRLDEEFQNLCSTLGLGSPYEAIDYDGLTAEQKQLVDGLNLTELFEEQLYQSEDVDVAQMRFLLRRLGQLDDPSVTKPALEHIERLHPVFPDLIGYLSQLSTLTDCQREKAGARLLDIAGSSFLSAIEYYRIWALDIFASSTAWNCASRFHEALGAATDLGARRALILAMGRAAQRHWFQARLQDWSNESPWPRRAFLAAASCLPKDARSNWYKSVNARLDPLEQAVRTWAEVHPFSA